jgi:hypothetical protein
LSEFEHFKDGPRKIMKLWQWQSHVKTIIPLLAQFNLVAIVFASDLVSKFHMEDSLGHLTNLNNFPSVAIIHVIIKKVNLKSELECGGKTHDLWSQVQLFHGSKFSYPYWYP